MKQVVVLVEDKVGILADISYILGKAKINIDSISATAIGTKGVITLTVSDEKRTKEVLENNGYKIYSSDILVVKLEDKPGELAKISKMLADNKVNIENVHVLTKDKSHALYALKVDKTPKAQKVLKDYLTSADDML
jgi:hypothetical protein